MKYETVLFVDDDQDDLLLFQEAISKLTAKIVCHYYNDPENVIEHISRDLIKPDVIFLDIYMPAASGLSLLSQLKFQHQLHAIPIYILSACEREKELALAKDLGCADYFLKPVRFEDLVALLRNVLMQ